jgi:DNA primase
MALPAGFLDELRARIPLAPLIGRRTRLVRSGRQFKACCPFHGEKTPSFYIYDDHYHCFGCGAHGDAIAFVMQSQGVQFMEAVEQLAAEAGLDVPKPTPAAAEAERRRLDLYAVLQAAAEVFQRRLWLPEGATALGYLRRRGLTDETIRRFGLGWSGEGRGALAAELSRQEIEPAQLIAAGLMTEADAERPSRELFFNRLMFPIRDRRGRIVSFGGRTLGDGQPKYLNGPETDVFSKRRTLYGLDLARAAAHEGRPVMAVEGYMDVIALHQAGFGGAVAPLGTALTEEQLGELWRLSPMPVLCFDGDAAGGRAAGRAAELALPLLAPDRSLKVATLPPGEDPDTLVLRQGAGVLQGVLDQARPLVAALYDLLREGGSEATPEQRAAFRVRLEAAAGRISDKSLASEYRRAWLDMFFSDRKRNDGSTRPARGTTSPRPVPDARAVGAERCRALVAILLRQPNLLPDVEEALGQLDLPPRLERVRSAILAWSVAAPLLDSAALLTHLTASGLEREVAETFASAPMPLPDCASAEVQPAEAEAGWWHLFGLLNGGRLEEEVLAASRAFAAHPDEAAQRRLVALCAARDSLRRGGDGDDGDWFEGELR